VADLGPFPEFALSASQLAERDCDRKLYWGSYGYWGGWNKGAPVEARTAYLLKKARSKFSLLGDALHSIASAVITAVQIGRDVDTALATAVIAQGNKARRIVDDAVARRWENDPKNKPAVLELLYKSDDPNDTPDGVKAWVGDRIAGMTDHLMESQHIAAVREGAGIIEVETMHQVVVELDELRVPVWVQPDLVYGPTQGKPGPTVVVDWKTGRERVEHEEQLYVYGLYANQELNRPAERISLAATYLEDGEEIVFPFSPTKLSKLRTRIGEAVHDRRRRVVGGDLARNEPLPMEDAFRQLPADARACRWCDFRRLCGRG
jgi:hypothetical protein